jgi:hypothetical protein
MIEVMYPRDIEKINDPVVASYLHKRFQEMDHILHPQTEGYFLYVEEFSSLHQRHSQHYFTLPSIDEGLIDSVENVKIEGNIVEVSILFNNEFMMSLIFHNLTSEQLQIITKEVKV